MRRSLTRAGYQFTASGRGRDYQIKITGLSKTPTPFEVFAKREFACGPQTRIDDMETFFSLLFFHPNFRYYPATYQSKFLKENLSIEISSQTLHNWKKKLIDLGWIVLDDTDCKYYSCRKDEKPVELEQEKYKKAWRKFYARIADGEDPGDARKDIYYENNGMPRKQLGFLENGIEQEKLNEFKKILHKSY